MGTESEQTHLQRKDTDNQQACEKVLNTVSRQRNAEQSHRRHGFTLTKMTGTKRQTNKPKARKQPVLEKTWGNQCPRAFLMRVQTVTSALETV